MHWLLLKQILFDLLHSSIWRARLFLRYFLASFVALKLFRWRFCLLHKVDRSCLWIPLHALSTLRHSPRWSIYALFGITSLVHLIVPILLYRSLKGPTCSRQQYHCVLFARKRAWNLSMQLFYQYLNEKPTICLCGDRYCKDPDDFEKSKDRNVSISIINSRILNRIHGKGGRRI